MRIDLGCGTQKHHNCLGIDRRHLEEADLICDFTEGIPLADNSVDFLMACRSLEYSTDFLTVMTEIYRVCKHLAVVCIVAPYAHSSIHMANPRIRTVFNEYTPFFLTPSLKHHSLAQEFNVSPEVLQLEEHDLDFRLINMEFLYFPKYHSNMYEIEDLEALRENGINVVNEIMYHFVVVKQFVQPEVLTQLKYSSLEEPVRITEHRRHLDQLERKITIVNEPMLKDSPPSDSSNRPAQPLHSPQQHRRTRVTRPRRSSKKSRGRSRIS